MSTTVSNGYRAACDQLLALRGDHERAVAAFSWPSSGDRFNWAHGGTVDARRADLLSRAARWRTEGNHLAPRAAEVARTVVRSCQLRLAESPAQATEVQPITAGTREVDHVHA
jgi:hypothetical protein